MKHFVTVKLERRTDEGLPYSPGTERQKVDHEPGYIRHSVTERWHASCVCGWEGKPRRRRSEAVKEGRKHS